RVKVRQNCKALEVKQTTRFLLLFLLLALQLSAVEVGLDLVFQEPYAALVKGKKIGLITNHTAINKSLETSVQCCLQAKEKNSFELVALFAPEHGIYGDIHAEKDVATTKSDEGLLVHSLHGKTRRPTPDMLKGINLLVFDIQDIGVRSYTYASTL